MAANSSFSLPIRNSGPPLPNPPAPNRPPPNLDYEVAASYEASITWVMLRVVRNGTMVTDEVALNASECRSMKKLTSKLDREMKKEDPRAWEVVHGKYAPEGLPSRILLQKTIGPGTNRWVEATWDRPGTYSRWFNLNITSGHNEGSAIKVEIHYSESHLNEYLGRNGKPTEEELAEELEREMVPKVKRPYRRFTYVFEQRDLVALELPRGTC